MSDESPVYIEPPAAPPRRDYFSEPTPFRRILDAIPAKEAEASMSQEQSDADVAAIATAAALKRSEARRDAILAVALAVARRGQNPMTDWTTQDTDTAYAIADMLIALEYPQKNP